MKPRTAILHALHRGPVAHRVLADGRCRMACSFAFHVVYAAWEIGCGAYYRSFWFVTLGCYYILLATLRLLLLRTATGSREAGWRRYRACGGCLLLMDLILAGLVILVVTDSHRASAYAGYLVYAMAAYTFYKVTAAIVQLGKHRRSGDPVQAAVRAIGFASALVSLLSLEIAMVLRFGGGSAFLHRMTIALGCGVCATISLLSARMLVTARKRLSALPREQADQPGPDAVSP